MATDTKKTNDHGAGRSFVEAVCHKYIHAMEEECDIQVYVPKKGPAKVSESGDLILPRILHLTSCNISHSGPCSEIRRMCINVCELDFTQNLFTNWTEILRVVQEIPNLSFLNLTSNPLNDSMVTFDPEMTFPSMKQLILNNTGINWASIIRLLEIFPSLTELHLSLNNFTSVDVTPSLTYPSLCKLHFNGNQVADWHEVKKLGHLFQNLETFVYAECNLSSLGSRDEIASAFPRLSMLNLNKSLLSSWEEVDRLRHFPKLVDVRLVGIPFLESFPEKERREITVARTPTILRLNGSRIKDSEREDAERAFVRRFQDEDVKPPRFYELEAKYGKLEPLVKVDMAPKTTFKVKVILGDKTEEMEVSTKQTVAEFKKFLTNVAGCPPSKWRLYYCDKVINQGPELMRYPTKNLYSYNLTDGDEFTIQMKE